MICSNPRPHDPHNMYFFQGGLVYLDDYCEGRTAPAPPPSLGLVEAAAPASRLSAAADSAPAAASSEPNQPLDDLREYVWSWMDEQGWNGCDGSIVDARVEAATRAAFDILSGSGTTSHPSVVSAGVGGDSSVRTATSPSAPMVLGAAEAARAFMGDPMAHISDSTDVVLRYRMLLQSAYGHIWCLLQLVDYQAALLADQAVRS